jgi:hypothetical protein
MLRHPRCFPAPQDERIVGQAPRLFQDTRKMFTPIVISHLFRALIFILEFSTVTEI